MYRYQRLLVALSLTEEDLSTIGYASLISGLAKTQKVYFAHVADTLDAPKQLLQEHPEAFRPTDEYIKEQMQALVGHYFTDGDAEVVYEVGEGSPTIELLGLCRRKAIDLVICGQKRDVAERSRLPEKLARKAPCSVMIVPEGSRASIKRILVPVDFSKNSEDALEVAIAFARAAEQPHLFCLHAYRVPTFYYETGQSYEQFVALMMHHAERDFDKFLEGADLKGVQAIPIYELSKRASNAIKAAADDRDIDLVVMGARGRRPGAEILLGSVTERAIHSCSKPLMAVKEKGSGMSLLKALKEL